MDWTGEYNSFIVPFSPFGAPTLERFHSPDLELFLRQLGAASGADQTITEPNAELGITTDGQTGGPRDPQPGIVNGGPRDTQGGKENDQRPAPAVAAPVEQNVLRQNPQNALDVNNDGSITPMDALIGINALNAESRASTLNSALRSYASGAYLDVSGDGQLSPLDSLLVINWLNRHADTDLASGDVDDDSSHVNAVAVEPSNQQYAFRLDVNRDGSITPLDSLLAINALNCHPSSRPDANAELCDTALGSADVSGDGFRSPLDPLLVINWLNQRNRAPQRMEPDETSSRSDELASTFDLLAEDVASTHSRSNE